MNLTSLANVKAWLNLTATTDDAQLTRMIAMASNAIFNYTSRPNVARKTYIETRDGAGNDALTLKNWPVVSVAKLQVGNPSNYMAGIAIPTAGNIPAAPALGQPGFTFEMPDSGDIAGNPQVLSLSGYIFPCGRSNVQITYDAGYCIIGEAASVPATPGPYTVQPLCPSGPFAQNDGPTYATGVALTLVKTLSGTAGQYTIAVDPSTGLATYTFNAADQGAAILLNYSFIPADLEQACFEIVGERYKYKGRIGVVSTTLGGQETMSYSQKPISDFVKGILQPYKLWFPI